MIFGSSQKTNMAAERQMQIFEMEMMQNLYSYMTDVCLTKCIPNRYTDNDLTKGESVCIDRCAAKFMESFMITTKKMSTAAGQQQPPQS